MIASSRFVSSLAPYVQCDQCGKKHLFAVWAFRTKGIDELLALTGYSKGGWGGRHFCPKCTSETVDGGK